MKSELPLAGVRIVDFTWVGAGPLTTRVLADFGADVIKIESKSRPDVLRVTPPLASSGAAGERSGYFAVRNANKRSMSLDMQRPEARAILRRLLETADVVANSFAPGVMERWGLDYGGVSGIKPDIIYLEMPMLGSEGPYRNFTGFGATLMAVSGAMDLCGYPDRPPVGTGTNYPDHVPNPMHAAFAVMSALIHRRRTGIGQKIEVAQLESTVNVVAEAFLEHDLDGPPRRKGNHSQTYAPHGVYPTSTDDRWVAIAVEDGQQWPAFCDVIDRLDLMTDDRFATHAARVANADFLDAVVSAWTRRNSPQAATVVLQHRGIAAGPVNDAASLMDEDANIASLDCFKPLPHPEMGVTRYVKAPIRMSRTPARLDSAAPLIGQHTDEVCRKVLGMAEAEIETLRGAGAFG